MWKRFLSLPLVCALSLLAGVSVYMSACSSTESMQSWQGQTGPVGGPVTPVQMLREIGLKQDFVARGRFARVTHRPMYPRYITIHSTQNKSGDAFDHAKALKQGALRGGRKRNGRTGYMSWHFTVQDNLAIQHLPTREQGEHADFDGPGNRYSVGIEMCEHRGNHIGQTIERTAKLAAYLMKEYRIPISNVVPHYYWPREGMSPPHKDCPHFLLENGRPGRKWGVFLSRVRAHYARIMDGSMPQL